MHTLVAFAFLLQAAAPPAAPLPVGSKSRLKDIVDVRGMRENALIGYGLVVGLGGTGDTERVLFTEQSISGMLGRLGVRVDPGQVRSRNVAGVVVTAALPTFLRPGAQIDVTVSSLGDARSLVGGTLILTPLFGPDGKVYATGQGSVQTGGVLIEGGGSRVQRNQTTSGRVPSGGTVEAEVHPDLDVGPIVLGLRRPDFSTAKKIADAVNALLGSARAKATDPAAVEVDRGSEGALDVIAKIEDLEVESQSRARLVISERTGTVVAGQGVRIRPVVVAQGNLQVAVAGETEVSQPLPFSQGKTTAANRAKLDVTEGTGPVRSVPAASTVDELVAALNVLGATPRDLIAILQALQAAGAIDAEIVVI